MRIHDDIVVRRWDDTHVVILDETTGEEILINEEIALKLLPAMQYFFPASFVDITPPVTEVPTCP